MAAAVRRIGIEERRARLARRHRLAAEARADDPVVVARDLVALHATDPASVYLAAFARMRTPAVALVERALYVDRTLVRMLGMRRTMFVVPTELVPVVQASSTRTIAVQQRRLLLRHLVENRADQDSDARLDEDPEGWLAAVEAATLRVLAVRGEATGAELSAHEPRLRTRIVGAQGKAYEVNANITTRVLFLLAAEGHIVRGRPLGSWTSSQYRWSSRRTWLPGDSPEWTVEDAQVELVRRWLAAYGPGTRADLAWWTGWTARDVKRALARLDTAEVELDRATGLVLADDVADGLPGDGRGGTVEPWVALLPALDPTVMGWSERDWYLGPHRAALFDRSGNPGPTVWCDGRIVGGWAQRRSGEVAVRLLEDIGGEAEAAVEKAAADLTGLLGSVRVTPRFRTPLERELSG